jgi:hypothetical protein
MKHFLTCLIISLLAALSAYSQTLPDSYDLSAANYSFKKWPAETSAGDYPPNMIFHTTSEQDPPIDAEMDGDWTLPYDLTSKSRINGWGEKGIIFNNTSTKNSGAGYLGAATLAFDTRGRENIEVNWKARVAGFSESSDRRYAIRLQYRSADEEFVDVMDGQNPVEFLFDYTYEEEDSVMFTSELPEEAEDKETVYIRWIYYQKSATEGGGRPELAIDDIIVASDKILSAGANMDEIENIRVFPNPSSDFIRIVIEQEIEESVKLSICDVNGRLNDHIYEGRLCPGKHEFSWPVGDLSDGMYFINYESERSVKSVKHLVKK